MLAARILLRSGPTFSSSSSNVCFHPNKMFVSRLYSQGSESVWKSSRGSRSKVFGITKPVGQTAFDIGKGALAGGAVFGIGALCYYGLGLSSEPGAIETARIWPQYVQDRISSTYTYFGSSVLLTAGTSYMFFQSPRLLNLMMKNSWVAIIGSMAAMMGTGMLARSIEYQPGLGPKQLAWMLHACTVGAVISPLCLVGGPILTRAALYTAGIVGGLSTVAACAPSDQFLYWGGPLACGLGVVFASSIGTMFLPPTTALGAGLMSVSLYGGLLLFSGFLLYDTQRIIRKAEVHPLYAAQPFDPINESISIYLDTLNIFIRLVYILSSSQNKRR